MANINKIGLLLLDTESKRFLVCEKSKDDMTSDYIMPGGQVENGENDEECLAREIKEELAVELDKASLLFIGEYVDVAAGDETKTVSIKLYKGRIVGEPKPSQEIVELHWIGKEGSPRLSPIIKNKILPDIIAKNLLK